MSWRNPATSIGAADRRVMSPRHGPWLSDFAPASTGRGRQHIEAKTHVPSGARGLTRMLRPATPGRSRVVVGPFAPVERPQPTAHPWPRRQTDGDMRHAHTVEQVRAAEQALMATLPEGALMQRAAAGLATRCSTCSAGVRARGGAARRRRRQRRDALYAGAMLARRGVRVEAWCCPTPPHEAGLAALDARRRSDRRGAAAQTRPGRRRHRRDRRAAGPAAEAAALRLLHGVPVVAVDVPSGVDVDTGELAAATRGRRRDRHLRHAQGRATSPTRPRRRAAWCTSSTSGWTSPTRPSRASRPRTSRPCCRGRPAGAQVHPRRRRRPGRLGDLPRRRRAVRRGRGIGARRDGALRRRRPAAAMVAAAPRGGQREAGSRPGPSAPAAATGGQDAGRGAGRRRPDRRRRRRAGLVDSP